VHATQRLIEDFRGDYQSLARMVQRSWEENSQQTLCYSAEFLESLLKSPGATASLAPTLYEGDTLLGFASGFPRSVEYRGQSLRLITSSFLSVLPEYKKSGFGIVLWSELVRRIRATGFDGMVNFCVDGEPMNRMVEGCCRRLKFPVHRIFSVRYMSSLLKPGDFTDSPTCYPVSLVKDFLKLAASIIPSQPLARKWTVEEAQWQCLRRTGALTAYSSHGPRRGILTGYVTPISNHERTRCLLVEDILWDELDPEERLSLLRQYLSDAASQGVQIATVPILGYTDLSPFKKFRFLPTRRVLHCYLTLFSSNLPLETLPSMYLDVF
jgi:hypothetical protein